MKSILMGIIVLLLIVVYSLSAIRISAISESTQSQRNLDFSFNNDITIMPQQSGTYINILSVSLESPGFVIIKSSDQKHETIGQSQILPPGLSSSINIALSKSMKENGNFIAELHIDNGNKYFDSETIDPVAINAKEEIRKFFYIREAK